MAKGDTKVAEPEDQNVEETASIKSTTPEVGNIVMTCVLKSDLSRFAQCFEDEGDPFHQTVVEMLNERGDDGKTPLDIAAILGRTEILHELIIRGAEINKVTGSGYSALHQAACWGKIDCIKALVEKGADIHMKTSHGERARESAQRYGHLECVDYLDWAEEKQNLVKAITLMRETLTDPEKVQGRLSRDDKNTATSICNEKWDWIENTPDATTNAFINQRAALDEALAYIWQKLTEPVPEKPEKK